jgi:hypothetical protein
MSKFENMQFLLNDTYENQLELIHRFQIKELLWDEGANSNFPVFMNRWTRLEDFSGKEVMQFESERK